MSYLFIYICVLGLSEGLLPTFLIIDFLSDLGPIIVYPCQSLTDSLTDEVVEDLMN